MNQEIVSENSIRVLLVDDEVDFATVVSKRLTRQGLSVYTVEDGVEAYTLMETRMFDVVVLDLLMPGPDGLQTLKAIRKRFPLMPVLLLTGTGGIGDAMKSAKAGAFDFLTKPIGMAELLSSIQSAVKAPVL